MRTAALDPDGSKKNGESRTKYLQLRQEYGKMIRGQFYFH